MAGIAWRRASAASWRLRVLKNGSVPISSALDRSSRKFSKMSVSWPSVLARRTCSCNPNLCAAACTSRVWLGTLGLVGLTRRAMTVGAGDHLVQKLQPLGLKFHVQDAHACNVAARLPEIADKPEFN